MVFVILPQLIRIALPGLANLWMILLKDTSYVSIIGLADILRQTSVAARISKEAFFFYFLACMLYLVLAIVSSIGLNLIERWSRKAERSEEHTSELQSLMRIPYAVFCLKKNH